MGYIFVPCHCWCLAGCHATASVHSLGQATQLLSSARPPRTLYPIMKCVNGGYNTHEEWPAQWGWIRVVAVYCVWCAEGKYRTRTMAGWS